MLMNYKKQNALNGNRMLSRKYEIFKKQTLWHFKTLPLFSKLILLIFFFFFAFIRRASRILSRILLISCAIKVVFQLEFFEIWI